MQTRDYSYYNNLLKGEQLPSAILDKDLLDKNIKEILKKVKGVKIRIASKSIRSTPVLKEIIKSSPESFSGIMAFTITEALFLIDNGFSNILIGYPSIHASSIEEVCKRISKEHQITFMVDLPEHIQLLDSIAKKYNVVLPICIDIDMSTSFPGIYFGVYRSSIKKEKQLIDLLKASSSLNNINIVGVMGYEAQIAGVGDNVKGRFLKNKLIQILKNKSIKKIASKREEFIKTVEASINKKLTIVNAGGTGSINSSIKESLINEITVGSGFFSPALFDNYGEFKYKPALFYGVEVSRNPLKNIYVASGGGYIASGTTGVNKQPKPFLPNDIELIKNEGMGEVQTPFKYNGKENLKLGNPVFFRHAKAGELCERFNELVVVSDNKIIDRYKTYRGEGKCFL
jgi:D-serine deaminase-like pyridoxal phosphate-dependent protein